MAKYTVARAFIDIDGVTKQAGWQVELPLWRALVLYRHGFILGPVYRSVPPEPWQTIHGTARRVTSYEENVAGLESAIELANDLRLTLNEHYADALDHTTAPDLDHTIVGRGAIDLPTLLALTGEMLVSYDAHDADAELLANWLYHAATEAGDHSLAVPVATPPTLELAITRLNDLKAKYNGHDADAVCHGVGSNHQIVTADADYGPVIRVPVRGALSTDLVAWGVLDPGTGVVVGVRAIPGDGHVDFEFSDDPQDDCVISYMVSRKI